MRNVKYLKEYLESKEDLEESDEEEDWNEEDGEIWEEIYLNREFFYLTFRIYGPKITRVKLEKTGNHNLLIKNSVTNEIEGVVFDQNYMNELLNSHPENDKILFELQMLVPIGNIDMFKEKFNSLKRKSIIYYQQRIIDDVSKYGKKNKIISNAYNYTQGLNYLDFI